MADQEVRIAVPQHLVDLVQSPGYPPAPADLGDAILAYLQRCYDAREQERRERDEEWREDPERGPGGAFYWPEEDDGA